MRAWDGTYSVQQPLIEALYGGRTPIEVLALLLGEASAAGYDIVRATFKGLPEGTTSRRRGAGRSTTACSRGAPSRRSSAVARAGAERWRPASERRRPATAAAAGLEAVFVADASVYDGRFANNAWLQELPDPLTQDHLGQRGAAQPGDGRRGSGSSTATSSG